ncbi:MAG: glycosyltransferase [Acidobacteria bacterium]|nr:glycosyltransferase [Acidobacteriota bacterium]
MTPAPVAVVITCYNLGRTLREAAASVLWQTRPPAEWLIVDDGSDDLYTLQEEVRLQDEGWRILRTPNRGVSAARNAGVRATSSPWLVLLDADDVLEPSYLERMLARAEEDPALDFVSCSMQAFGASAYVWRPPDPGIPDSCIWGVVHNSSLFARRIWETVGGFDEAPGPERESDFWMSALEHGFRGAVVDEPLLRYRVREASLYHQAIDPAAHERLMEAFYRNHWHAVSRHAEEMLVGKEAFLLSLSEHLAHVSGEVGRLRGEVDRLRSRIADSVGELQQLGEPPFDMGEARRTTPVSARWGVERGTPIDRVYIEQFLERHKGNIRGRVLEVKDPGYTLRFGGEAVTACDVIDVDPLNARASIHADLSRAGAIPAEAYDAFVLTQTLGLVYDVPAALRHAFRILKPGGVLLCTVPAAGRLSHEDRGLDGDYWRFTEASLRRLFAEVFPLEAIEITGFGNVLADAAFLYGLAAHELSPSELAATDPCLPLVYGVRAVKPRAAGGANPGAAPLPGAEASEPAGPHARTRSRRGVILAYHRVSSAGGAAPRAVSTPAFRAQMTFLREHCRPLPLARLADAVRDADVPDRAVAVTFDDGYLDVLTGAVPILVECEVPATAFVTSEGGQPGYEFWWDLLDRIFAPGNALPSELVLPTAGIHEASLADPPARAALRQRLTEILYALPEVPRKRLERELAEWGGAEAGPERPAILNLEGIARLAATPGITIGAHGARHLCLPLHDEDVQRRDVEENKRLLERIAGYPVTSFAYPFGERSPATVRIVREAGFTIGVTVDGRAATGGMPRLLLPRCEVPPGDDAGFKAWLWGLFDARD